MSKKTRKKSSKSATGRSTGKPGGAKAKTTKRAAAKSPRTSAAGKASEKAKTKSSPAKGATSKKTAAKASKRSATKPAVIPVRKSASLSEGNPAPAFSLPRDGGQLVSLANYAGRKLVIFFYPRADTPGCTLEAIAFSRLATAFAAAQTSVLGVSADAVTTQEKFRDKHELTVPLVSDEKHGMLKAYGVWGEKSMYGKTFMGIVRTTVLVDGNGKIARIWRNMRVDGHADGVLAAARVT